MRGGDAPGCSAMLSGSASGKAGVVRACVKSACAERCFGNGRAHQRCSLENGGDYLLVHRRRDVERRRALLDRATEVALFSTGADAYCGHYVRDPVLPVEPNLLVHVHATSGKDGTGDAAKCNLTTLGGTSSGPEGAVCCITFGPLVMSAH